MTQLDGDISYQCWICPHCFDDHHSWNMCDERKRFEDEWNREVESSGI